MKCTQCNTEMPNDAVFCTNCGMKMPQQASQPQMNVNTQSGKKSPLSQKQLGIICGIVVAAIVVIVIIAMVIANRKTTLNMWDYAKVSYEGYDGYGTASIEWNKEKLIKDAIKGMKMNSKDKEDLLDAYKDDDSEDFEDIMDDNDYDADDFEDLFSDLIDKSKLDKTEDLKNGDQLTVKFRFDNDDFKEYGLKFKATDKKTKVKNLKAIEKINPFDYLDVEYEGTSPNVQVVLSTKEDCPEVIETIGFQYDVEGYLKDGDKFKVTISSEYGEEDSESAVYVRSHYGCELTETEKEYTVENVDSYIFSNTDLEASDAFANFKTQTETILKEKFANDTAIKASGLTYVGYYFLTKKISDTSSSYYGSYGDYNKLYMVYSAKIKSNDEYNNFKATTVYFPVCFDNTIKKADGTFEQDLESYETEGSISLGYHWMSGYTKEADMKNALVVGQGTSYDCAKGGALK